jgi:hypothetical protein
MGSQSPIVVVLEEIIGNNLETYAFITMSEFVGDLLGFLN